MRAAFVVLALSGALGTGGCAPEDQRPATGSAQGTFDCEIFVPGANPPNVGDGVVDLEIDGEGRTLAQGAAAYAVDGNGSQTLDPAQASYFAVQVFQNVSPELIEVFEVRVLPDAWVPGEVVLDGVTAVAYLGEITHDANGTVTDARIVAESRGGTITLEEAGDEPAEPVAGTLTDLQLVAP